MSNNIDKGTFDHKGTTYTYTTQLVDTFYGPERKLEVFKDGQSVACFSECMTANAIIGMFCQFQDYEDVHGEDNAAERQAWEDYITRAPLSCPHCKCDKKVVKINRANMRHADPTETYTLECGHTVI